MKAKIKIGNTIANEEKICPYIFGNFVEDIRDHMDAMLAYPLKFMDFEGEDDNGDGISGCWYAAGNGRNTRYVLEPAANLHSGHSQLIKVFGNDECDAGIAQKVHVKGNVEYKVFIYARASLEIKFIDIEVVLSGSQKKLASVRIPITSHNWREYSCSLSFDSEDVDAEFRVMTNSYENSWKDHVSTGMLWLDHISILPSDAVGNVKKEVFHMSKDLNCGMMRLAGNYISGYHWENAVGPYYLRPNLTNEAWGGWTNKYFGTDEFMRFCTDLKVEPMICVNAGSGTPEEAAEWIQYCNAPEGTNFGDMRASNGHKDAYGVKYWEVGNEIFGPWQIGHCNAEEYAERFMSFQKKMKEVDSSVILLACGNINKEWNRTLIETAGEYMDYITLHIYHGFGAVNNINEEERFKYIVSMPEYSRKIIKETEEIIKSNPKYSHIKIAITEYNTMYYPNTIRKGLPDENTLEAAVANAANLNEYLRNSELVKIGSFSDLVNGWLGGCIRVGDYNADQYRGKVAGWSGKGHSIYGTPTYYVLKMYAEMDIAYKTACDVECDKYNAKSFKEGLKLENLPVLDAVSCVNEKGDNLTIFVVNRGLEDADVEINSGAFAHDGNVEIQYISGDNINALNSVFDPENVVCRKDKALMENDTLKYKLKAHSIYTFVIKK